MESSKGSPSRTGEVLMHCPSGKPPDVSCLSSLNLVAVLARVDLANTSHGQTRTMASSRGSVDLMTAL